MDPDPPRPAESSPQRPEDAAPPPPADDEDVSPTLGALKNVGGAALAGLGAVKNVAAGLAATVLDDLLEPEQSEGGALDDVLRRMSGDEDGDGSPPGGLLAHTRNEERRRREARVSVLARHRRDSQKTQTAGRVPGSAGAARARREGARCGREAAAAAGRGGRLRPGPRPSQSDRCRPARAAARVLRRVHRGRLDHPPFRV